MKYRGWTFGNLHLSLCHMAACIKLKGFHEFICKAVARLPNHDLSLNTGTPDQQFYLPGWMATRFHSI